MKDNQTTYAFYTNLVYKVGIHNHNAVLSDHRMRRSESQSNRASKFYFNHFNQLRDNKY